MWAVYTERKSTDDKKGGSTKFTQSERGTASGRDTNIGVQNIGPSSEHIEQFLRPLTEQLAAKDAQIVALTDQIATVTKLLWKGTVDSISEGAAKGNGRLEKALDHLNVNKIREAVELLEAAAKDSELRVEKDSKEAAIAYRDAGIIACFVDRRRALEAFEKALD